MKNFLNRFKWAIIGGTVVIAGTAFAAQISVPSASGPGFLLQSLSTGNYNPVSLTAGTNVTISTTTSNITINASGGGGGISDPFTHPAYGSATSTIIGFTGGLFTTASSTVVASTFHLAGISSDGCATITSGIVSSTGSACGSSSGLTAYDAFTHPIAGTSATTSIMQFSNGFLSNASSTITGPLRFPLIPNSFLTTDSTGQVVSTTTTTLATSTPTIGSSLTYSGTFGDVISGVSGSLGINSTSLSTNALTAWNGTQLVATGTPQLTVGNFLATSTTGTSQIGGSLFSGAAAIAGLGTSNSQLQISQSVNNLARQLDLANISMGANAEGGITFENGNSTNAGATSAYIGGLVMGGPNFATAGFSGLAPNGMALFNTDGSLAMGATSINPASSTLTWYAGNNGGFGGGNPDMTLRVPTVSGSPKVPTQLSGGNPYLGLGTTSPQWLMTLYGSTTPQLALGENNTGNIWTMRSAGNNLYIATSSPLTYATSSATALKIDTNGFLTIGANAGVGCGQFDANGMLTNTGSACGSGGGSVTGSTGQVAYLSGTNTAVGTSTLFIATNSRVGIASTTPWGMFSISPNALGSNVPEFVIASSSVPHVIVKGDGSVGIGVLNPTSPESGLSAGAPYFETLGDIYSLNNIYANTFKDSNNDAMLNAGVTNFQFGGGPNFTEIDFYGNGGVGSITMIEKSGNYGWGTTTPQWMLNPTSATAPQLALSSGGGKPQWTFRAETDGGFDISSTTVAGTATSSVVALGVTSGGVIKLGNYANCNGTSNALGVTSGQLLCDSLVSDQRLKKDINPITDGLQTILSLQPKSFFWKDLTNHNTSDPREQYGFIAQNVEKVLPSAVGESPDGYKTLDKTALIAPLVSAVQTLNTKINNLQRSAEENWQDVLIGLLVLGFFYQQRQIQKLQKK